MSASDSEPYGPWRRAALLFLVVTAACAGDQATGEDLLILRDGDPLSGTLAACGRPMADE